MSYCESLLFQLMISLNDFLPCFINAILVTVMPYLQAMLHTYSFRDGVMGSLPAQTVNRKDKW
jgi:hypothetical protein